MLAAADLTEELKTLDVPISIVLPDSSPFVPVQHGVELHGLARHSKLRVVPGVRHGLPFAHAREEAFALLASLEQYEEAI
jgi:3-oxoadipate enol-lactonase